MNLIKKFVERLRLPDEGNNGNKKIEIATCALFVELAKTDSEFTAEERKEIVSIMQNFFHLSNDEASELLEISEEEAGKSISLYEFTTELDAAFSQEEKYELLKNFWRLIYSDKILDPYEDNLVKRIGGMLNIDRPLIISAKLEVKKELGL